MYKIFNHQNDQLPPQVNQSPRCHPEFVSGSKGFVSSHVAFCTHEILNQVQHDKTRAHVGFYIPKTLNQVQGDELRIGLRAFTLAEVMIVLAVIGILTAILLSVARNATPNEDIMKFKKAHNTLHGTIRELVNSDKYYLNGDLGVKVDGTLVDSSTYFCETLADVVNTKQVNCSQFLNSNPYGFDARLDVGYTFEGFTFTIEVNQGEADKACKNNLNAGDEIILNDGTVFYQTSPGHHFGWIFDQCSDTSVPMCQNRYYGGKDSSGEFFHKDENGFDRIYKVFCIDIDGLNRGEDPFGYGIRADGKILNGAKADEWLEKSIQDKN